MAYYKIKNITGRLPKRHAHKNTNLKIEYNIGFQKKKFELKPDQEIVLSCKSLPVSVHNYRAKEFALVLEISENEFMKLQKPSARKSVAKPAKVIEKKTKKPEQKKEIVEVDETNSKVTKKRTYKKKRSSSKSTTNSESSTSDSSEEK